MKTQYFVNKKMSLACVCHERKMVGTDQAALILSDLANYETEMQCQDFVVHVRQFQK